MITHDQLLASLSYDPSTGLFTRLKGDMEQGWVILPAACTLMDIFRSVSTTDLTMPIDWHGFTYTGFGRQVR